MISVLEDCSMENNGTSTTFLSASYSRTRRERTPLESWGDGCTFLTHADEFLCSSPWSMLPDWDFLFKLHKFTSLHH